MNPQEINKRIAIACGWKPHPNGTDWYEGKFSMWVRPKAIPNYYGDLNAMHEAEETFGSYIPNFMKYLDTLKEVSPMCVRATAAQRAEAFLRTIGQWEDEK